jgi:ribose 5-phosphate isomerase B
MKIAIGSDEAGFGLKEIIFSFLKDNKFSVTDYGVYDTSASLYPDTALKVAQSIKEGVSDRGILICGTGIGMAMTANKVPGIRAAQCHDTYSAERAKKSNDAQIITMGSRVIGPELAKAIVLKYLESDGVKDSSIEKISRMMEIESSYRKGN